jgi:hypothetical protein
LIGNMIHTKRFSRESLRGVLWHVL